MTDPDGTIPTIQPVPEESGLARASLVVGIVALILSLFFIGGIFGVAGIVLGLVHLFRRQGARGLAWAGISISSAAILVSVAFTMVTLRMPGTSDSSAGVFRAWEGVPAPDLSLTTLDGRIIRLSSLKGKRVVLDFWATWCGPCVQEIPEIMRLYRETSREDLEIIGISDETVQELKPFVAAKAISYPVASAKDLPAPFSQIEAIPTTFFIDRNGVIQAVRVGSVDFSDLRSLGTGRDWQGAPKSVPQR